MKTCTYLSFDADGCVYCENPCEGNSEFCASHNRLIRKEQVNAIKSAEKRKVLLSTPKKVYKAPSKNPKDWSNTFLCSDGTRVTQKAIDGRRARHYEANPIDTFVCEGCGETFLFKRAMMTHAHIIPQARCKTLGKTELIWLRQNWFFGCIDCNRAIENPKGNAWKDLLNIRKCLSFIKEHDQELYAKFQLSAVNQERQII